jgi:hypothetical protein
MWKLLLSIIIIVFGLNFKSSYFDNNVLYSSSSTNISDLQVKAKQAFDEAEPQIFKIDPKPNVIDVDKDPKKCICKGTGIIIQGDGHKTVCPYHGGSTTEKRTK